MLDSFYFHQKEAILCSISLQTEKGISKIDIAYCAIACTAALIKISFPAFDIYFYFHPSIFIFTLTNIHANIRFLVVPRSKGMPRCLPVLLMVGTLSSSDKFLSRLRGHSLLKHMPDYEGIATNLLGLTRSQMEQRENVSLFMN